MTQAKTIAGQFSQITELITANGNNEITGTILQQVLLSLASTTHGSTLQFQKAPAVSESDIGKLMMLTSDTQLGPVADVYQLSPPSDAVSGQWQLQPNLQTDLEFAIFDINNFTEGFFSIDRATWRNGATPTTLLQELELIRDHINNHPTLSTFLTASVATETLIIDEIGYTDTEITLGGGPAFDPSIFWVSAIGMPALAEQGTAMPLGVLVGVENDTAIMAQGHTETYLLENGHAPVSADPLFLDTMQGLHFSDPFEFMGTMFSNMMVPANGGRVRVLDPEQLLQYPNDLSPRTLRSHYLGFVLSTRTTAAGTDTEVTVLSTRALSPIIHAVSRVFESGMPNQ